MSKVEWQGQHDRQNMMHAQLADVKPWVQLDILEMIVFGVWLDVILKMKIVCDGIRTTDLWLMGWVLYHWSDLMCIK